MAKVRCVAELQFDYNRLVQKILVNKLESEPASQLSDPLGGSSLKLPFEITFQLPQGNPAESGHPGRLKIRFSRYFLPIFNPEQTRTHRSYDIPILTQGFFSRIAPRSPANALSLYLIYALKMPNLSKIDFPAA